MICLRTIHYENAAQCVLHSASAYIAWNPPVFEHIVKSSLLFHEQNAKKPQTNKTKQNKTKQNKTKQNKTKQNKTKQNKNKNKS